MLSESISPFVGANSPAKIFINVLFPTPLFPLMPLKELGLLLVLNFQK